MKHVLIALFVLPTLAHAQLFDSTRNSNYWISFGGGNYSTAQNREGDLGDNNGNGWNLEFTYKRNDVVFSGFYNFYSETLFYQEIPPEVLPNERRNSLGLMAGKSLTDKYLSFNLSAGLGMIWGTQRGDFEWWGYYSDTYWEELDPDLLYRLYNSYRFHTVSIPVSMSVMVTPVKFMGLGMTFKADFNPRRNVYGMFVNLTFGKVR